MTLIAYGQMQRFDLQDLATMPDIESPSEQMRRELVGLAVACQGKTTEQLTEHDKLALAIMAGCEFETAYDASGARLRTKNPIAVVMTGGKATVYERR